MRPLAIALALAWPAALLAAPPPMAAVGVLAIGRMACSGTLIAPDLVLTAGHCVLRRDRRSAMAPHRISFRTGAYPGFAARRYQASDVVVHPLYIGGEDEDPARLRYDGGLVRLAQPVPPDVSLPRPVVEPGPDVGAAFLASYRAGRGERARERRCPILLEWRDVVSLSCDVRPGESGSPIVAARDGEIGLVGIVSASSRVKRTEVTLAARASALVGALKAVMGGF